MTISLENNYSKCHLIGYFFNTFITLHGEVYNLFYTLFGFMTYTGTNHLLAIEMVWLQFSGLVWYA